MHPPPSFEHVGRQNPSPGIHLYPSQPTCVFLTVTTEHRSPWLANPTAQQHLETTWGNATGWLVSDYLLMPDHLHCFCFPSDNTKTIERWISYWKDQFRKLHKNPNWRFQSRGWHHRLRSDESSTEKWHYVLHNPVRKNLVTTPDQWPFKGRIHNIQFP